MKLPKLQPVTNKKKRKILLLSDDLRLPSGIGTISREIVLNTVDEFDWVQLGAALEHPEHGKGIDISADVVKETGVQDASVKIIPWTGYGDRNILMALLNNEKPDAIMHFTDPRYWTWLYALEHEIKNTYSIPIIYYSIWDDLPFPMWNAPYYASCDLIMGISKQSHNIHNEVLNQNGFKTINLDEADPTEVVDSKTILTSFVPHGLNHKQFRPIDTSDEHYQKMYADIKTANDVDFLVMWNNRNIRRKQPGDVILAFKEFHSKLPKEKQDRVGLLMHTAISDANGTDLRAVWKAVAPECKIIFSESKLATQALNAMYNVADVVINIASNEGWGLSSTEALLSGTPIINNVTGGLQDQCGFLDADGNWIRFSGEFTSNHAGKYKTHGKWAKPVFPSNRSLQGSPATPYIFDDRVDYREVADAIMYWYNMDSATRKECGEAGREFCLANGLTAEQMGQAMKRDIAKLFEYKPTVANRYTIKSVTPKQYENIGITQ
jgi:glycosyltransferase involved in cell wall biosynthesis